LATIEKTILSNLIHNEEFSRKVVPFLKKEYFLDPYENHIADELLTFFNKYNKPASLDILAIQLSNREKIGNEIANLESYINELTFITENNEWLLEHTEKFCKERALQNAILDSFDIIEGKDKIHTRDAIPSMLSEALSVCFDTSVGHDYFEDHEQRFDFYHRVEERIPFDLELFNKVTKGGLPKKSLTIAMAGTGVGKSLFMCHVAASTIMQGKNVLYITMEMSEEQIAKRIDTNLLNMTTDDLETVDKDSYDSRMAKLIKKNHGSLIVKEYPEYGAHAGTFRALIEELKIKKNFHIDMLIIDYLNICASSRLKAETSSYTYIKSIASELRGLSKSFNIPVLSATQTTRGGYDNSDVGLTDTSESFGLPATADIMFALITTDELTELNQMMVKILKNRYNDPNYYKRFVIGVDRSKMRLYNAEDSAQKNISDSGQTDVPNSKMGNKLSNVNDFKF
jgi:replicative DNA helicase